MAAAESVLSESYSLVFAGGTDSTARYEWDGVRARFARDVCDGRADEQGSAGIWGCVSRQRYSYSFGDPESEGRSRLTSASSRRVGAIAPSPGVTANWCVY